MWLIRSRVLIFLIFILPAVELATLKKVFLSEPLKDEVRGLPVCPAAGATLACTPIF